MVLRETGEVLVALGREFPSSLLCSLPTKHFAQWGLVKKGSAFLTPHVPHIIGRFEAL